MAAFYETEVQLVRFYSFGMDENRSIVIAMHMYEFNKRFALTECIYHIKWAHMFVHRLRLFINTYTVWVVFVYHWCFLISRIQETNFDLFVQHLNFEHRQTSNWKCTNNSDKKIGMWSNIIDCVKNLCTFSCSIVFPQQLVVRNNNGRIKPEVSSSCCFFVWLCFFLFRCCCFTYKYLW